MFATHGAAPGSVLHLILMKAIVALHKVDAIVSNMVSGGNQTNKSAYKAFWVSGKMGEVKCWIEHPMEPHEKMYMLFDVPHLYKCIRNHLFSHTYLQVRYSCICIIKCKLKLATSNGSVFHMIQVLYALGS